MGITRKIPATAIAVKVTNFTNPNNLQIYHEDDYIERLNEITGKLQREMKFRKRKKSGPKLEPIVGDSVIMHNRPVTDVELPAWWVRGILNHIDKQRMEYSVLLVDHGYTVRTRREDFTIVRKSLIPYKPLTMSVGIYKLLPLSRIIEKDSREVKMRIGKKWSSVATFIARELIQDAKKLYFDYLALDDNGKPYGELYLVIEEQIVSLSEVLIHHEQAMYFRKNFISMIKEENKLATYRDFDEDGAIVTIDTKIFDPPMKHEILLKYGQEPNSSYENHLPASRRKRKIRYVGEDCQQILVHSSDRCERLVTMEDARFPSRIHAALKKLDIIALRRMQAYMWPAVSKGLSVLAIGPPRCGKTIGYIVPIVSAIAQRDTMTKGPNPLVLILCSSTSNVLDINEVCSDLLQDFTDIRSVAGMNGRADKSLVADIYNGCQILISTPPFLVRFLRQDEGHKKLINFSNLQYLVFDELEVVLSKYYEPLKELLQKYIKIGSKERPKLDQGSVQIVAVSRHWTSLVQSFADKCVINPYICIGSYMEAAIFGCIRPQLFFVLAKKKIEKISELLTDDIAMIKTMIVCGNSAEAHALNEYVSKTRKTLLACEKMIFTDIYGIRECWKACVSGIYPVLICTDEVLVTLNITDIDWLIHFTIDLASKSQFYFRFSTLMDNLKQGKKHCKVTVAIDETNNVQLYGAIMVAENCGTKIPEKLMNNVMKIVASLDYEKKMYPLCNNVKAFGFCPKKYSCPYRHCVLAEVDKPLIPFKRGDRVRLHVTYVHNATHFTARIIEYTNSENKVTRFSASDYTEISSNIQCYYANRNNRRCHPKVNVGDICVIEKSLDDFQRVKILNISMKNYDKIPIAVEVKCIDSGHILSGVSVTRLMEIPKELADRDTHIVEVFLAGLVPNDEEYEWNSRAIDDALNWFPDKKMPNSYVLATVKLHLGDTIWVDPLEIHTPIIGNPILINSSLKRHMLQLKHGKSCDDHLPKLYELCRIGGFGSQEEASDMTNISDESDAETNLRT